VNPVQELYTEISSEIDKAVIGKTEAKTIIFSTFLARGNVLLEGVPGIAKTLLARSFARVLGLEFSRIQFTPDLMPSDIIGTSVYNQGKASFEFVPGPLFSDFILADEVNRAPAKTQAALLEAMEERQVSCDNSTYKLSRNFIVFATQNPLEFEGTYALPEAQLDRFMVRIIMDYPAPEEETAILAQPQSDDYNPLEHLSVILEADTRIQHGRKFIENVIVDEKIFHYVRDLTRASRSQDELLLGNSPRAGQMLIRLSKSYAAVSGSDYVTPDHIRELVPVVLPHRWVLKPEAEIQQTPVENILRNLFNSVSVPQ
jgi:MoxR-like ATPase